MGTRSRIAVMHGNIVKSVYCHWDGYLEHNGAILQQHYDSPKANNLVALGDISSLGSKIGEQHPFSQFEIVKNAPDYAEQLALYEKSESEGWCTFYGRDRGEKNTEWKVAHTFEEFLDQVNACGAEYYYIMNNGIWYCGTVHAGTEITNVLALLTEALKETA
jgi:hypothetical protein